MNPLRLLMGWCLCWLLPGLLASTTLPAGRAELTPEAGAVFDRAMAWADQALDPDLGLLRTSFAEHGDPAQVRHSVRDSAMYAAALVFRDGKGDRESATRIIEAVLRQQLNEPGRPYHGTFHRFSEDPPLRAGAVRWKDYDSNWRHFVSCCWLLMLRQDADKLPETLRARMLASVLLAMDGELGEKRLEPRYSNIALMHAFVALSAGELSGRADLKEEGTRYLRAVRELYRCSGSFSEFNSPTYYGVDLFALGLWRTLGPSLEMREAGWELEHGLWVDIGEFYHAGLRNLCGPFDRTYGMDMCSYLSLTGLQMRLVLGPQLAPLPELSEHLAHGNDLGAGFLYPRVPTRVPEVALRSFRRFSGPHRVECAVGEGRRASAWLGDQVMIGAMGGGTLRSAEGADKQYRPASLHWRLPSGEIGWLTLVEGGRVDAAASTGVLTISVRKGAVFRIYCGSNARPELGREAWRLPGLELKVKVDGQGFTVRPCADQFEVHYPDTTTLQLRVDGGS